MENWIWWESPEFYEWSDKAREDAPYYNINQAPSIKPLFESRPKFISSFGSGPFQREANKIGFKLQ